jgi:hypothetical protein
MILWRRYVGSPCPAQGTKNASANPSSSSGVPKNRRKNRSLNRTLKRSLNPLIVQNSIILMIVKKWDVDGIQLLDA